MPRSWRYLLLLAWFSYLLVSGVLIFTRGFLLRRDVQKETASCQQIDNFCASPHSIFLNKFDLNNTDDGVLRHRERCPDTNIEGITLLPCISPVAKVVLIVIDALKFDFAQYDQKIQEPFLLPYQNKLTIMNDMLTDKPKNSKLFRFVADPPTTTMQRLKGLTTGTLPTFIDIGSNFATPEINEDNLLDQLTRNNKHIVFLGDDTWSGLYPNRFIREYSYPSFNVWDLDTVDTSIMNNLVPEIRRDDWSLLIAHFLGVDHCGHRFGPFHDEMSRKLSEMNDMIKQVIETIDNDTMLFVVGDHGMTATGNHGGDSEAEVNAAMFVYSSKLLNSDEVDTVSQIDLVPTLATILGLPIPFSNLGSVIFSALPLTDWQSYLQIIWNNVHQLTLYINQYSENNNQFSIEKLTMLQGNYTRLREQIHSVTDEKSSSDLVISARKYLKEIKSMCQQVWVQFDPYSISRGLLLTFLSIFLAYLIISGIPCESLDQILSKSFLLVGYGIIFGMALCSIICSYFDLADNIELNFYFFSSLASILIMAVVVLQNWPVIADNFYQQKQLEDWTSIAGRLIIFLSLCVMFSNSYIVEEASVLSYLLVTMLLLLINDLKSMKSIFGKGGKLVEKAWFKSQITPVRLKLVILTVVFCVLLRLSQYYWRCREEQPQCITNNINTSATLVNGKYRNAECLFTLICLAVVATIIRIWLRCCGNLAGFSPSEILARYGPTIIIVCTGGFWVAQSLPKLKVKMLLPWQLQFLPWIVYAVVFATVISLFIRPLCVYIVPNGNITTREGNKIPLIFNQMKELMKDKNEKIVIPVVYGLATVYSSVFVILCLFSFLLISLLLGDVLTPSAVLMFATGTVLLVILSIVHYEKALFVGQLFNVQWSSIICWSLLSSYFFYGTGHQPTFPGIQWNAAMVGTGGQFSSHIVPALLVGINTFGSQLLSTFALPLLLIGPFTIHVMFPMHLTRGDSKEDEMKRGEMILYEKKDLFYRGMFMLVAKYMLIHGLRIFASMLAATIHCRHLMVWKIFAPKLIFEAIGLFVTLPCLLFVYLMIIRITGRLESLMYNLEEKQR